MSVSADGDERRDSPAGARGVGGHGQRPSLLGRRVRAVEADRLVAGRHGYVADLEFPDVLEVAVVRSPHAHAAVRGIDCAEALRVDGVHRIVTAAELTDVRPMPDYFDWAKPVQAFPLARDRVRYVGAPVAAVVAEDRYVAEDAAGLVDVDFAELPAVISAVDALAADSPLVYEDWGDNKMVEVTSADAETDAIFATAASVVSGTFTTQRHGAVPMEPRATVGSLSDGLLTIWTTNQFPHICRAIIATCLGVSEEAVRVIAPELGGGFGSKCQVYAEEILVAWLAMNSDRPVRFVEDRVEHLMATTHARDMAIELSAALGTDGDVLAVRGRVLQDLGSEEVYPPAFAMGLTAAGSLALPYRIPRVAIDMTGVVTNKTPAGAYRGFGLAEAVFAIERLLDKVARETRRSPVELRRSLLLRSDDLPYTAPSGAFIDSGSHLAAFERAVELGQEALREESERARPAHLRLGLGLANYVEGVVPTFLPVSGRWRTGDSGRFAVDPSGQVSVRTGLQSMGQGLESTLKTITAEYFQVSPDDVVVTYGRTDGAPESLGSWGSRSTGVFAGACALAAETLVAAGRRVAAEAFEAVEDDIGFEGGVFRIKGTSTGGMSWGDVAALAPLEASETYVPEWVDDVPKSDGTMNACATYTNSSQASLVEVDIRTGRVQVLKYLVVHDCGTVINPTLVEAQVQGGVAQGIGGTLLEEFAYDEAGQPTSATLADYLLPLASDIPPIVVEHIETPSPLTPLGLKGAGEAGIAGPAAAIAAAVEDALGDLRAGELSSTPLTPWAVAAIIAER
jgi:carbon-monoxide dehydrogenase large subunit